MRVLVCGAGGFIGSHLAKQLAEEGCDVHGVDLKAPLMSADFFSTFNLGDLRNFDFTDELVAKNFDEIYQLAADMGGAGYIFSGSNDADIMTSSVGINVNFCRSLIARRPTSRIFYSSSACVYPEYNQLDPSDPNCVEESAYPAAPDSEYGWEKLFSERLYKSLARNAGVEVRIARYHNIYGPYGSWCDGREKAPAALCRKVAETNSGGTIEVWGDGKQTRSFLYIDACIAATRKLMRSDCTRELNIGSEHMVSINELANLIINISGKKIEVKNISGPEGVRGRNSDNNLIRECLGIDPAYDLEMGLKNTYEWISRELNATF